MRIFLCAYLCQNTYNLYESINIKREVDVKIEGDFILTGEQNITIKRVIISEDVVDKFQSESDFLEILVEILVEVGSYTCLAASNYSDQRGWSRSYATVGGNMVRLYKLVHALIDQICQNRGEIVGIIQRLISESVINIQYLIQEFDDELIKSYICYSLSHEKKLWKLIHQNISRRGGIVLPIEDRMIKSIEKTCKASGQNLEDLPNEKIQYWGRKNLFEKSKVVGLDRFYLAGIGSGSNGVHGNWQEIYGNHLETDDDKYFKGSLSWSPPRPQVPLALATIITRCLILYFHFMAGKEAALQIEEHLSDLYERIESLTLAHERYIQTKIWPNI